MADDRFELDAETRRLLWALAVVAHQTPADYVAAMIIAEYDRQFPGKRAYATLPVEERRARLMQAMGWTSWPTLDEAGRRELAEKMNRADAEAARLYGEGGDRAAAA
jgi:hypothetical protein